MRTAMNANLRTNILFWLTLLCTLTLTSPAQSQSNATDSTFFPMHQGNRWVYMSYSENWQTSYFVYDQNSVVKMFGDTLCVWEDAHHLIIYPPLGLGFNSPD